MNSRLLYALVALTVFVSAQTDEEVWDATVRDKTPFCSTMSRFSPDGETFCEQFTTCCDQQFDPNNGDKCQVKESECSPSVDGSSKGVGVCKYSNCTELITTTTTTTTQAPQFESINAAFQAITMLTPLAVAVLCVM